MRVYVFLKRYAKKKDKKMRKIYVMKYMKGNARSKPERGLAQQKYM